MKIVIVGNAPAKTDLADEINTADLVIRFNMADIDNYNGNTGTKTDVLCVTNLSDPGRSFAKYRRLASLPNISQIAEVWFPRPSTRKAWQFWLKPWSKQVFRETDYSKFILSRNGLQDKKVIYFDDELYIACCAMLNIAADFCASEPSSGFLALQYVLRNFYQDGLELLMTGFSFSGSAAHPWEKEKQIVVKLHEQGLLKLV